MKKFVALVLLSIVSISMVTQAVFAAPELPKASVWFDPATVAVSEPITVNALVYNNQVSDATVTVAFTTTTETIGTASALIAKGSAKTITLAWKMPVKDTVVTAKVTSAITSTKKSLPGLIGTLGTVTVGSTVTPTAVSSIIPGAAQINAWFAPLLTKVEAFRVKQKVAYTVLKTNTQKKIDASNAKAAPDDKNSAAKSFGNPWDSFVLIYATTGAAIFASQAIFYIAAALIILLILRFVVNLIF
ncbi:MAG: hypothetical protein ABIO57_02875 [Candidatus Paceibacterota bacterium]